MPKFKLPDVYYYRVLFEYRKPTWTTSSKVFSGGSLPYLDPTELENAHEYVARFDFKDCAPKVLQYLSRRIFYKSAHNFRFDHNYESDWNRARYVRLNPVTENPATEELAIEAIAKR